MSNLGSFLVVCRIRTMRLSFPPVKKCIISGPDVLPLSLLLGMAGKVAYHSSFLPRSLGSSPSFSFFSFPRNGRSAITKSDPLFLVSRQGKVPTPWSGPHGGPLFPGEKVKGGSGHLARFFKRAARLNLFSPSLPGLFPSFPFRGIASLLQRQEPLCVFLGQPMTQRSWIHFPFSLPPSFAGMS